MSEPVLELLKSKGISYSISGKDYVTKCFNPEHTDTNPSFRIDRLTGICHCFSCGFKCNLFKFYGLLSNNVSVRVAKLKEKLKALSESTNGLDPMEGEVPFSKSYRDISAATYKLFGAFQTDDVDGMERRLIFPIKDVRNKTVAYVGRLMDSEGGARYKNYPAGANIPLYPVRFEDIPNSIVLVEGLFDMLNCYDKGLRNVVCTFGTSKLLSDVATKMLSYKVMGIEKVFIMFDGDTAGREAARKMKPLIEEIGFTVEIVDLEDDTDPGGFTQKDIDGMIEYTK